MVSLIVRGFLAYAPGQLGGMYPGMCLIENPSIAVESITSRLDGPVCGAPSLCGLAVVLVCRFCDTREVGFYAFLFVEKPAITI